MQISMRFSGNIFTKPKKAWNMSEKKYPYWSVRDFTTKAVAKVRYTILL